MSLFWLIVLTPGKEVPEFLMFWLVGQGPPSLWDCSSRCCCGEQDPGPSRVALFLASAGLCIVLSWSGRWNEENICWTLGT